MSSNSLEYCRHKAAPEGSSFYYCTLHLNDEQKRAVNAVSAYYLEVTEIPVECSDPGVARIKLHWWHEELERIYAGIPRHPIGLEIAHTLTDRIINREHLASIINYTAAMLDNHPLETETQFTDRLAQGPGQLWHTISTLLGMSADTGNKLSHNTGIHAGRFEVLKNIRQHCRQNRCLLPKQTLSNFGLTADEIAQPHQIEKLKPMFMDQFSHLKDELDASHGSALPVCDPSLLPALIMNRILAAVCEKYRHRLSKKGYIDAEITPIKKLWIARTTRRRFS